MNRFVRLVSALLMAMTSVVVPTAARAGLIGTTVSASLKDLDAPHTIFDTSAVVTNSGPEFSGTFNSISWRLDILDNGFDLEEGCPIGPPTFCSSGRLQLTISGLNFTPPATLIGLTNIDGFDPLLSGASAPSIGPSSVSITFQAFSLDSGSFYSADFRVTPRATTPFPATLLLLSVGLTASGILVAWRRHI